MIMGLADTCFEPCNDMEILKISSGDGSIP